MPNRCVAGGCSNYPDPSRNIGVHKFPDKDSEKSRWRAWVQFVRTTREGDKKGKEWNPSKSSRLCSEHFKPECFEYPFINIPGASFPTRSTLKIDAVPSIRKSCSSVAELPETPVAKRIKRRNDLRDIRENILPKHGDDDHDGDECEDDHLPLAGESSDAQMFDIEEDITKVDKSCQTSEGCLNCKHLSSQIRQLKNKVIDLKNKIQDKDKIITQQKETIDSVSADLQAQKEKLVTELQTQEFTTSDDEEDFNIIEEEPCTKTKDGDYEPDTESEAESESDSSDEQLTDISYDDDNLRTQPKFVVFISQLLLLFHSCPSCKHDNPIVKTSVLGTMVQIVLQCINPHCKNPCYIWKSQPTMTGTKMPAGNFLLCFSTLVSGASPSKVFQVFRHMGLCCISLRTYFRHQTDKLFPSIHLFWKNYQDEMIEKLKTSGKNLAIAGDGRHDSMGHSAKYCAYTMFCCNEPLILHFSLVQRNVADSSPAMEKLAFTHCMDDLVRWDLLFDTLITDRHTGIAKYMRENMANKNHYFDLWHLKKKVHKVLTKLSKEKDCDIISDWIEPCENHLMWSATSTPSGDGELIWAKFESFLSHIINKHRDLENVLFNKCSHEENIPDRQWLEEDTKVYDKVCAILKKKALLNGIKQASPMAQTSCIEGFHSVINHYSPKMTGYSYQGMYCRHIIAAVHFNYNLYRAVKLHRDGSEQVNIIYPKFKNGKATVKKVRVKPNYDYIESIYDMCLYTMTNNLLRDAIEELDDMTPEPMNTMLNKQSRDDALDLWKRRQSMVVQEIPSTFTESQVEVVPVTVGQSAVDSSQRRQPKCRHCEKPMKGHKFVLAECLEIRRNKNR